MAKTYALEAVKREQAGKGAARSLRREGKIPAVIYGDKKEPVKITLDMNTVNVEYNKGQMFTTLCELKLDKDTHLVLARDLQLHPVTDIVEHADFLRVTEKTKISVAVPVSIIDEDKSPGLRDKGVLNITRFEVEVNCRAKNIPDEIQVSVADKEQGDSVNASDAVLPEGTTFVIDDRDFTIATIVAPKTMEELEEDLAEGEEGEDGAEGESAEGDAAEGDAEGGEEKSEGGE